ncbi:hypothetical protein [Ferrimonas sp.]|uniref:hypothetical protein n=1 Tax=Ferrimonas sp. TaxID=2080861 RepID=UPI003A91A53D
MSWVCPQCHVLIDDDTFSQCWNCCAKRHPEVDEAAVVPQCERCDSAMVPYGDASIDPLSLVNGQPHSIAPFKLFACPRCGRVERYLTSSALERLKTTEEVE